ncbi:GNAT family N-acetyltransferase [Octadecabacter sp. CECT 8868]|uniref:GNAT family N-acetyltransferase n=1 Tax=Octadecabacter algicola TaxID=2909342 RepID=UPI001F1F2BEE|nr:GNAT family N-acetyltransferase [Octadecabacter algicola]MCF2904379.1 GNAT family N-acetyltransferase [Octadecabacter algicola]
MKSEFLDVPQGKVAAVVTHLQMFEKPAERPTHFGGATLIAHDTPDLDWYRDLYTRVGGQDWLWFSRLGMSDDELVAILNDPANQIYSANVDGRDVGMLELDFRITGECEIGYFGLTADMVGTGAGRWLMEQALSKAWAAPITRLHVHTCTLDSPQALPFYVRSGFKAFKREIEIADDPRLVGALPKDSAPQLPIIPE